MAADLVGEGAVGPCVLVVGCGNMGAALAAGYVRAHPAARVIAIDPDPARARSLLPPVSPVTVYADLAAAGAFVPDIVILAVKPQLLGQALPALIECVAPALVISIAAGTPLARLQAGLNGHQRLVRAMPNLPVVVGAGASTLFACALSVADLVLAEGVFAAVGSVDWLPDEAQIDAATALAGSGPGYVFAFVEHLAAAGVAQGLTPALAARLARQTVIGAAAQLAADPRPATVLKAAVCSPKGTTEAGLRVMEQPDALPRILADGVAAAHQRAGELARAE
ncbi:pyrroline-5-carboxylate reductase [Dechloromonas sp. ZS-1]|uniref:pyrroline-5-carboxylate reductase n=1 Tax=Dechloromonas sp. ZS-1 TaxID=3138067 RepID=UPI0031FDB18D